MKIGILEILGLPGSHWTGLIYRLVLKKQYASVPPHAISVWCRQLGHQAFYATYYGFGDPARQLPPGSFRLI
jgi:hypothetical protein